MKTKIVERVYQTNAKAEILSRFETEHEVVLAACPSSGKTQMAIDIIKTLSPPSRVLILAHNRNLLKSQWGERLEVAGVDASEKLNKMVTYSIPAAIYRTDLPQFDLIVVDEGHQYVFTEDEDVGMVKKILKHGTKILYLTGTPSKFIARKYKPIIIPAVDLIPDYVTNLYVGLASTTAKLEGHYNRQDDLTPAGQREFTKTTNEDLDSLLEAIAQRLTGVLKTHPVARRLTNWMSITKLLSKTMIACTSIDQAIKVKNYFDNKDVRTLLSHSDPGRDGYDPDSKNFEQFQSDAKIKILTVVDRGVLGFDMPDLVNVVDMTGTRKNIDRIYQLYARVMRINPQKPSQQKFFFKVVPGESRDVYSFWMTAALMMIDGSFISRYNGKNLGDLEIPIRREMRERNSKGGGGSVRSQLVRPEPIDALFSAEVSSTKLLTDIWSNADSPLSEYKKATIREVKERLGLTRKLTPADYFALAAKLTAEGK